MDMIYILIGEVSLTLGVITNKLMKIDISPEFENHLCTYLKHIFIFHVNVLTFHVYIPSWLLPACKEFCCVICMCGFIQCVLRDVFVSDCMRCPCHYKLPVDGIPRPR